MPVYVAAGSLLPTGRLIQHTGTLQQDLTWYVYAGKDGHFTLYEDEGTNYNYEKGKYSLIECTWNDRQGVFHIGDRKGAYAGMPASRLFHLILVEPDSPVGLDTPSVREITVPYQGKALDVSLRMPTQP
jgi:alpha-D-xyloside xylohydrolase